MAYDLVVRVKRIRKRFGKSITYLLEHTIAILVIITLFLLIFISSQWARGVDAYESKKYENAEKYFNRVIWVFENLGIASGTNPRNI